MTPEPRAIPPVCWSAVVVLLSCEAVATAAWLVPASVAIVQWPSDGPHRVALLAPTWQLAAWWAGGLLGAAALLGRAARAGWIDRGGARESWDAVARHWRPGVLLWLWVVPYLPWIPDRWPLLLVLSGPMRWVVVAVAMAMAADRLFASAGQFLVARAGRRTIVVASLALYLGLGLSYARVVGVGGDEPHYLVITESLRRDGDLKIENNHRQGDYRSFFSGELRPDFFERGKNREIYSVHAPGLPALLIPFYVVAGRVGAVVFIALCGALAALAIFDLAAAVGGRGAALVSWAGCCLTVPFLPHAWLIFPEIPGALVVAWAALWLWQPADRSPLRWALRSLAIATLPWLHTKFAVFLAIFATAFALRLLRQPRRLLAFVIPIALSLAGWFYSFRMIYGSWNPESAYGNYGRVYVLTQYIPHGLIGLFFDQKFGLLFYSPIYLASVAGFWILLRRRDARLFGVVLAVVVAAFVGSTARLYMFWGGLSAPARFLVPLLPCLAPMIAAVVPRAQGALARALLGTGLAISLLVAAAGVVSPSQLTLFSDPHGRAKLLEWLQAGSPLSLVVPTFTEPTWTRELGPLALWMAAAVVTAAILVVVVRVARVGAWGSAVTLCLLYLAGGAVVTARPGETVRVATARRGATDMMVRFDGDRYRTLDYRTLSRVALERFLSLTTFTLERAEPVSGSSAITVPVVLPPGRYEAVVHFGDTRPGEGEILVGDSTRAAFGRVSGGLQNPTRVPFEVPMATRRLTVSATDAAIGRAVTSIELVPRAIVPPPLREPLPVRAIESVGGSASAFLGYTDEHVYPEGGVFWTRGTARTRVLVTTGGASRLSVTLSTGPRSGRVLVAIDGESHAVDMTAGELNTVSFPLRPERRLVTLGVESTVMFRPADEDHRSTDMRGLGCQVRVSLE